VWFPEPPPRAETPCYEQAKLIKLTADKAQLQHAHR
jgi:hypothetical protein